MISHAMKNAHFTESRVLKRTRINFKYGLIYFAKMSELGLFCMSIFLFEILTMTVLIKICTILKLLIFQYNNRGNCIYFLCGREEM